MRRITLAFRSQSISDHVSEQVSLKRPTYRLRRVNRSPSYSVLAKALSGNMPPSHRSRADAMSFFIASIFLRHKYKEAFRNSIHVDGLFQDVFFLMRRARKKAIQSMIWLVFLVIDSC